MIPKTLTDFHGDCKPSGEQINYKHCPVCGSTAWKVFVDPIKGKWVCFGGRHPAPPRGGYPGGNLKIEGNDDAPGAHILELLRAEDSVPEWSECELPAWEPLTNMAKLYLKRRGLTPQDISQLGLVEWQEKFRILIPYFDDTGQLIYWNSRRYSTQFGEGPKYLTAPGKHPLYAPRMTVVPEITHVGPIVVEGCFDAIAVRKAGYTVVALGGKSLPRYLERMLLTSVAGHDIIYVLLDRDAMPQALRLRGLLSTKAGIGQVQVRLCPNNQDPGDLTPDQIRGVIRS